MTKSRKISDWTLIIVINFMWATQVPVIRVIGDRLDATTVAFIPMILSTVIFLPVLWIENKKRNVGFRWRWKDMKFFLVSGLIGIFLLQYLYTLGSQLTLAANAGIITLTIPVLVAVFASFMLKENLNIIRIISFVLAITGVLMTSSSDLRGADFMQGKYLNGNMIFLFACFCCAFYNTYCKVLVSKKYTELEILVYSSIVGSIAAIPLLIWFSPFRLSAFLRSGDVALYGILELSVIVYGVSSLLFFSVLKRMDVTQAILGNYLLPFFIAIIGIIFLGEPVSLPMIIGGGIIFISTLMVTVYEKSLVRFFRKIRKKSSYNFNS